MLYFKEGNIYLQCIFPQVEISWTRQHFPVNRSVIFSRVISDLLKGSAQAPNISRVKYSCKSLPLDNFRKWINCLEFPGNFPKATIKRNNRKVIFFCFTLLMRKISTNFWRKNLKIQNLKIDKIRLFMV